MRVNDWLVLRWCEVAMQGKPEGSPCSFARSPQADLDPAFALVTATTFAAKDKVICRVSTLLQNRCYILS
jgi:hypothetical protein